ncbi:glycosyltransferase family 2 protein [Oculatella sp. LEGE 06141]|uniref:hormogonium polysaccharide biosynthesis glycosyltransferase HpsE n=1 Tax=Oculatella sp. LEGE 06141 TaxID=1828648 RepID=UPI00187DE9F4|nr:hormogonium polysaccharide biosynthesis glycosyltransferase HpsE [Oculatella sp. LEGE 06141]MBE9182204.1 glycosyltransferase family 2 protein [Oculatella sp. LEGE 06141]
MSSPELSSVVENVSEVGSVDVTVAIPTYNGASRIVPLLEKLRSQLQTEQFTWEVLVVDNNSSDNTADLVRHYQSMWNHSYPLRYCFEPQQGLAFARQRAVAEARGQLVGFLDDDTRPDPTWVAAAYAFGQTYPQAGAYGGQIHGDFEVAPPHNFKRIQSFLAIKERGSQPHQYQPERLILPPGAGLVVRKQAWLSSVPARLVRTGRGGNDFEISLHLHSGGWQIWYNPDMHLYHHIPADRLTTESLLALMRTSGLCLCQIRMIGAKPWVKPFIWSKTLLGNLRRAVLHLLKYRGQLRNDPIAACEMEFFLSGFVSPFYLLKESLLAMRTRRRVL